MPTNGTTVGPLWLSNMDVLTDGAVAGELYDIAHECMVKVGWNDDLAMNDGVTVCTTRRSCTSSWMPRSTVSRTSRAPQQCPGGFDGVNRGHYVRE